MIFTYFQLFCVYGTSLQADISGCAWAIDMVDCAFNNLINDLSKHDVDGNRASYYVKENEQKK